MTMGKMTPTAERPRTVLAILFVSIAALALSAFVLESDVGPAGVAYGESWASPSEARSTQAQSSEAQSVLSFEFYRENVEPIFMRGHGEGGLVPGACVMCHSWQVGTPLKLQPLQHDAGGDPYWTEARSRHNYEVVSRLVTPGFPQNSRLLRKPLATEAGGTEYHVGGKFWESQDDPEWQILAEWVESASARSVAARPPPPQVDFDFFRSCVQRVFLNPREGAVPCTTCHAAGSRGFAPPVPEGRMYWNEEESRRNFGVVMRFVTAGYPMESLFLQNPLHPDGGGHPCMVVANDGSPRTIRSGRSWRHGSEGRTGAARAPCPFSSETGRNSRASLRWVAAV